MIFDDQTTLIVDCLHSDDEVDAFRATARDNEIATVRELTTPILAPCPPPKNQATLADWRETLFRSAGEPRGEVPPDCGTPNTPRCP